MRNFFENDYTSYRFLDGVLHIIYHQGVSIDLNAAVKIDEDRLFLHEGRDLPILCDWDWTLLIVWDLGFCI